MSPISCWNANKSRSKDPRPHADRSRQINLLTTNASRNGECHNSHVDSGINLPVRQYSLNTSRSVAPLKEAEAFRSSLKEIQTSKVGTMHNESAALFAEFYQMQEDKQSRDAMTPVQSIGRDIVTTNDSGGVISHGSHFDDIDIHGQRNLHESSRNVVRLVAESPGQSSSKENQKSFTFGVVNKETSKAKQVLNHMKNESEEDRTSSQRTAIHKDAVFSNVIAVQISEAAKMPDQTANKSVAIYNTVQSSFNNSSPCTQERRRNANGQVYNASAALLAEFGQLPASDEDGDRKTPIQSCDKACTMNDAVGWNEKDNSIDIPVRQNSQEGLRNFARREEVIPRMSTSQVQETLSQRAAINQAAVFSTAIAVQNNKAAEMSDQTANKLVTLCNTVQSTCKHSTSSAHERRSYANGQVYNASAALFAEFGQLPANDEDGDINTSIQGCSKACVMSDSVGCEERDNSCMHSIDIPVQQNSHERSRNVAPRVKDDPQVKETILKRAVINNDAVLSTAIALQNSEAAEVSEQKANESAAICNTIQSTVKQSPLPAQERKMKNNSPACDVSVTFFAEFSQLRTNENGNVKAMACVMSNAVKGKDCDNSRTGDFDIPVRQNAHEISRKAAILEEVAPPLSSEHPHQLSSQYAAINKDAVFSTAYAVQVSDAAEVTEHNSNESVAICGATQSTVKQSSFSAQDKSKRNDHGITHNVPVSLFAEFGQLSASIQSEHTVARMPFEGVDNDSLSGTDVSSTNERSAETRSIAPFVYRYKIGRKKRKSLALNALAASVSNRLSDNSTASQLTEQGFSTRNGDETAKSLTQKVKGTISLNEVQPAIKSPLSSGKIVVLCGETPASSEGNLLCHAMIDEYRPAFMTTDTRSDEKNLIYAKFISKFVFMRDGKMLTDKEVIARLYKSLSRPFTNDTATNNTQDMDYNSDGGSGRMKCPRKTREKKSLEGVVSLEASPAGGSRRSRYSQKPLAKQSGEGTMVANIPDVGEFRKRFPRKSQTKRNVADTSLNDGKGDQSIKRRRSSRIFYKSEYITSSSIQTRSQLKIASFSDSESCASDNEQEEYCSLIASAQSAHLHRYLEEPYFIEELAFHYLAGLSPDEKLAPLPSPLPLPELPIGSSVSWKWKHDRVLIADFTGVDRVTNEDKQFLGLMMERDDLVLIMNGLCEGLDADKILQQIRFEFPDPTPYTRFQRFEKKFNKDGTSTFIECDTMVTMRVVDFLKYLDIVQSTVSGDMDPVPFIYHDETGDEHVEEHPQNVIFYMTDIDTENHLTQLHEYYGENFKIKEILPGGAWCMMNHLSKNSRPGMGPHLYVSPGGGYTQLHQDGHGTVDSGHTCISGYNEVVMLRRLPEAHKKNACRMMPSFDLKCDEKHVVNMLYKKPHDEGRDDKPAWPTTETIEAMNAMNYCANVFILEPGQHLHIPKSSLHCFRKARFDKLPRNDAHRKLREELVRKEKLNDAIVPVCFSIAFDWMFAGITADGINREVTTSVDNAERNRRHETAKSLAIPETAILKIASIVSTMESPWDGGTLPTSLSNMTYRPSIEKLAQGILPALRYIIHRDYPLIDHVVAQSSFLDGRSKHASFETDTLPDSHAVVSTIDPYGSFGYSCRLCAQELSNLYFHCNGCEIILKKDYNICSQCFMEGKFLVYEPMQGSTDTRTRKVSDLHHLASCRRNVPPSVCNCHEGSCAYCEIPADDGGERCKKCSCICHKRFTRKYRFYTPDNARAMLKSVEKFVGKNEVQYALETECQLKRQYMIPLQNSVSNKDPDIEKASLDDDRIKDAKKYVREKY